MKMLITEQEFNNLKGRDLIPLQCLICKKTFYKTKWICMEVKKHPNTKSPYNFCSKQCVWTFNTKSVLKQCKQCNKDIFIRKSILDRSKTQNFFCSKSCSTKYNNVHKTYGYRRSKLEVYIEQKLKQDFPNLEIICNSTNAINSELDFYIPSLRIAIELNGIVHYEPIYTEKEFIRIQNRDKQKLIECYKQGIELIVLDVSKQKYFTEIRSNEFYQNYIKQIINNNLKRSMAPTADPGTATFC